MSDDELENVSGGGCWFGARYVAPDGHDVGCSMSEYRDAFDLKTFSYKFRDVCFKDGQAHDTNGRQYCGNGEYRVLCSKCGLYMDMNGVFSDNQCAVVDSEGKYLGMFH